MNLSLTRYIQAGVLAFMAGIFVSSFFNIPFSILLVLLILGPVCFGFKARYFLILGVVIFAFVFGAVRFEFAEKQFTSFGLEKYVDKKIELVGFVAREPKEKDNGMEIVFKPKGGADELISFIATPLLGLSYKDKIKVSGELKEPFKDWRNIMRKNGISFVLLDVRAEVLEKESYGNIIDFAYGKILWAKSKMRTLLKENMPEREREVLGAMVLGDQSLMTEETKDKLNKTGVRHVTAVSGQHVVILSVLAAVLFTRLGFSQRGTIFGTMAATLLFIIGSGLQSSSVRAGLMGGTAMAARLIGRQYDSMHILLLVAFLMLAANPYLLVYDAGFQLSFSAMLGLILFYPLISSYLLFLPKVLGIREIVAMTLSSQVFTMPLLLFQFHQLSLISIISNLLIVPMVPLIFILSPIFFTLGFINSFFAFLFSVPLSLLLQYLWLIVDVSLFVPFNSFVFAPSIFLLLPFVLILVFLLWLKQKSSHLLPNPFF